MAIVTESVSQLIAGFRKLQAKDAIMTESLGYILQQLADLFTDLLATADTSDTVKKLHRLLDGFKSAGYSHTKIQPLSEDRNHVYANIAKVNLINGTTTTERVEFIHQATTERAGAMREQQVTDLNTARKNVTELQMQMEDVYNLIDTICVKLGISGGYDVIVNSLIFCVGRDGEPHVLGVANLLANG
ncbi:MAG: hypothetical protein K2N03_06050 [Muribaculaceae bacterium]|nr:hypothetical protein [Muribaculaceae bacterium]